MELIKVEKYDLYKYADCFPDDVLRHSGNIFACIENDSVYGVVALESMKGYMCISWIWVEPDMRRKGIGTALLASACQFVKEQNYLALTIVYDPEKPQSDVLQYMLAKLGFHLLMYPFSNYHITRETLLASPLMRGFDIEKPFKPHTRALSELSGKELHRLLLLCEEKDVHFVSRADFSNADPQKTRLIIENGELHGIVLITKTDFPGEYELPIMFVSHSHSPMGALLLREAATELLRDPCGFSSVRFTCVSESSSRLADALLSNAEKSIKHTCEGILESAMLRAERGMHYGQE